MLTHTEICVCICVYMYMYMCVHVHVYVCTCTCTCVYMYMYMCVRAYVMCGFEMLSIQTCVCVCVYVACVHDMCVLMHTAKYRIVGNLQGRKLSQISSIRESFLCENHFFYQFVKVTSRSPHLHAHERTHLSILILCHFLSLLRLEIRAIH